MRGDSCCGEDKKRNYREHVGPKDSPGLRWNFKTRGNGSLLQTMLHTERITPITIASLGKMEDKEVHCRGELWEGFDDVYNSGFCRPSVRTGIPWW
ncbi:hypothetical protein MHYP_G00067160 [Metynnis hypsauchen]